MSTSNANQSKATHKTEKLLWLLGTFQLKATVCAEHMQAQHNHGDYTGSNSVLPEHSKYCW